MTTEVKITINERNNNQIEVTVVEFGSDSSTKKELIVSSKIMELIDTLMKDNRADIKEDWTMEEIGETKPYKPADDTT